MAKIDKLKSKIDFVALDIAEETGVQGGVEQRLEALERIVASHLTSTQIAAYSSKAEAKAAEEPKPKP